MYKNSIKTVLYPTFLAVAIIAGIFIGSYYVRPGGVLPQRQIISMAPAGSSKIGELIGLINMQYVDSVSLDSITEVIMPMIVGELDPHSIYIPRQEYARANENLEGEFYGIGVIFNMVTDTAIVMNVIPGGPSHKAGVLNGDRIIKVNDTLVAGVQMNQHKVVGMLRGKGGTEVVLSVERAGINSSVPITVIRDRVVVKSMTASFMITPEIAYSNLESFSKTSDVEISQALDRLRAEGMKKLIFDLRGNTGGFLNQAIGIANMFLPDGKLIVYTVDKYNRRKEWRSDGTGKYTDIELAILVDEQSASSSEILAGAIQDNDRGFVIGRRSFGKGLVQEQVSFADGSAVRLTTAKYYTPTGRSIQRPYTFGDKEYFEDFGRRVEHNELFSADSIRFDDNLKYTTPGGKTVYGGGGIMPDIFVPVDTTRYSPYYYQAVGRNILLRYSLDYTDRHREQLNGIRSVGQLESFFDADNDMLEDFVAYAGRQGLAPNAEDIATSEEVLLAQLRALIGRNTELEDVGFYLGIYPIDNVILKAMEVLGEKE